MRKLFLVAALIGCGGGASHSLDPSGVWLVTDTLTQGACTAGGTEILTIVPSGSGYALQGYTAERSYCQSQYCDLTHTCPPPSCELQGTKDGSTRDLWFLATGTAGGNRTIDGCLYNTTGVRR